MSLPPPNTDKDAKGYSVPLKQFNRKERTYLHMDTTRSRPAGISTLAHSDDPSRNFILDLFEYEFRCSMYEKRQTSEKREAIRKSNKKSPKSKSARRRFNNRRVPHSKDDHMPTSEWQSPPEGALTQEDVDAIEKQKYEEELERQKAENATIRSKETIEQRNELARLAIETAPQTQASTPIDSNTWGKLLSSLSSARVSVGEEHQEEVDAWMGHIENIAILGYQLMRATTFIDCFVAVAAYAKMYIKNKSLVLELFQMINDLHTYSMTGDVINEDGAIQPEDKEIDTETPENVKWDADTWKEKWNLFKTNTVFTKMSFLITAAMSLTVCSIKEINWSPFGVKVISLQAAKKQVEAFDVIDAMVETFTWMAETGYEVVATKSLAPILYSDKKMAEYNDDFDWVTAHADAAFAGNVDDLSDFESKVDRALLKTISLKKEKPDAPTAVWLQARYSSLVRIKEKIVCKRRNTTMRFQPIGFSLFGGTGVGKTTLGKLTMNTALNAMGYSTSKDHQLTLDQFDQYQSTYTSDIEGVFLDDLANLKAEMASGTQIPSAVIIKFFNNVAAQAVKAELNEKGIVFINFKCGVVTTNVEDLDARAYSNCAASILRRLFHIKVRVKSKFCKPGGTSLDTDHPELQGADMTTDIWSIDIREAVAYTNRDGRDSYRFETITVKFDSGEKLYCKDLGLEDYLRVVVHLCKKHKRHQENLLKSNDKFEKQLYCPHDIPHPVCSICKVLPARTIVEAKKKLREQTLIKKVAEQAAFNETLQCIECDDENKLEMEDDDEVQPESFEYIMQVVTNSAVKAVKRYVGKWLNPIGLVNSCLGYSPVSWLTERQLTKEMTQTLDDYGTPILVALTPECVFQTSVFQRCVNVWQNAAATRDLKWHSRIVSALTIPSAAYCIARRKPKALGCVLWFGWVGSMLMWSHWLKRKQIYRERYNSCRNALPSYVKSIRDQIKPSTALCAATVLLGVKLISMWNQNRIANLTPDSVDNLSPENIDKSPGWFSHIVETLGLKFESNKETTTDTKENPIMSATTEQVSGKVSKNLFFAEYTRENGTGTNCGAFFPRKSVMVCPRHVLYEKANMNGTRTPRMTVTLHRHKNAGGKFTVKVDNTSMVDIPDLDLIACYVPNCPDLPCADKFLVTEYPSGSTLARFVQRNSDYEIETENIRVKVEKTGHCYMNFLGGSYNCKISGKGSCMAPIIKEGKNPKILGFHAGGNNSVGVMQTITLQQMEAAYAALEKLDGVVLSARSGIIPESQYERPVISGPVHKFAHVNNYTDEHFVDVLGSTRVRRTQKSEVEKSILSDAVHEVTGVENIWGEPKMNPNWKAFNATLDKIVDPADMFWPEEMQRARNDWMEPLKPLMKTYAQKNVFRPLTEHEMVCGIDGVRFIDALPMNTSMGFPMYGKKHKHFPEVREGEKLITREIGPEVRKEMDRLLSCWKEGKRGYPVFSACLKDEPTKLTKDKVRVFTAAPVAFGLFIRKYFLMPSRFLSLYPREAELAVGINAMSPQWQTLMDFSEKFAKDGDGNFGMDYSAYDTRMNSQMTRDSMVSLIQLCEIGGYPKEDLEIMKMMIADFCHPLVEFNGTLLQFYNMNTSGNNITVQINCLGNSKYIRMCFYRLVRGEISFRKFVALITYGDDNKGSVAKQIRHLFNFFTVQKTLADIGVTITPPDKEAEGKAFFKLNELDFLKRNSVYHPDINMKVGALDPMSIYKSLHCNLKSEGATKKEVAIGCLEGASHEWWAHERETYEARMEELRKVADMVDLPVPALHYSFDERTNVWREKYLEL
jgi:flagellar biosynthesis GTPase FlhF